MTEVCDEELHKLEVELEQLEAEINPALDDNALVAFSYVLGKIVASMKEVPEVGCVSGCLCQCVGGCVSVCGWVCVSVWVGGVCGWWVVGGGCEWWVMGVGGGCGWWVCTYGGCQLVLLCADVQINMEQSLMSLFFSNLC